MPEGDTIHRTAVALQRALQNKPILRFKSFVAQISLRLEEKFKGASVVRVEAIGKNLLIHFSNQLVLHSHMRMTGSWHIYRKGERWRKSPAAARIVIEVPDFEAVCFSAPVIRLLSEEGAKRDPELTRLGPDLLDDSAYNPALMATRLAQHPDMEIGLALIRQDLISGIGNVYKSETLFLEKVNPFMPVHELDSAILQRLIRRAWQLMRPNLNEGRMRHTRNALDESSRLWVYKRNGKPCLACGTPIEMRRQGPDRRSTYFCRKCQDVKRVVTHLERYSGSF